MNPVESGVGVAVAHEASPLTEQQVGTLETQLVVELQRLMTKSGDGTIPTQAVIRAQHPEAREATIGNFPLGSRRKAMHLLAALGRIASGSYGICAGCDDPIAFERLEAIPETDWCRRCCPTGLKESRPVA